MPDDSNYDSTERRTSIAHVVRLADQLERTFGGGSASGSISNLPLAVPEPDLVQVLYCWDRDGEQTPYVQHVHEDSREIIIPVRGRLDLYMIETGECVTIEPPNIHVVPPGALHTGVIHPGAVMIAVLIPPEPEYRSTSDQEFGKERLDAPS